MSNNKYDIDGLIAYFEMAVKVMGFTNPEENSYEFHAAKMLKQLREERDKWKQMSMELNDEAKNLRTERDDARMLYCEFVAQDHREGYVDHPEQTPQDVAKSMGWEGLTFEE